MDAEWQQAMRIARQPTFVTFDGNPIVVACTCYPRRREVEFVTDRPNLDIFWPIEKYETDKVTVKLNNHRFWVLLCMSNLNP